MSLFALPNTADQVFKNYHFKNYHGFNVPASFKRRKTPAMTVIVFVTQPRTFFKRRITLRRSGLKEPSLGGILWRERSDLNFEKSDFEKAQNALAR